jgi:hypothetical protein
MALRIGLRSVLACAVAAVVALCAGTAAAQPGNEPDDPMVVTRHEFSIAPDLVLGGHLRLSHEVDGLHLLPTAPVRIDGESSSGVRLRYRRIQRLGHGWAILAGPDFGYRLLRKASAEWAFAGIREELNFDANDTYGFLNLGTQYSLWNDQLYFRADAGLGLLFSIVDVFYESDVPPPFSDALDGGGKNFALVPAVRTSLTVGWTLPDIGNGRLRTGLQLFVGFLWAGTITVDLDDTISTLNGSFVTDFGRVYYRPSGWVLGFTATLAF